MGNTSFTNLINHINEINIDPRLVDSFNRVLNKIQAYFNANEYSELRNYAQIFEKNSLSTNSNFSFVISTKPSKIGAEGFYNGFLINIDESRLKGSNDSLDSVLCHEFIHFLVMQDTKLNTINEEVRKGGFINEALTEMLNQQIYPNSSAYKPQTSMMKFANLLTGKVNNYKSFLRGGIDAKISSVSWNKFVNDVNIYQRKNADRGYRMNEAINDSDYINAQRSLITNNISPHRISNFQEYENYLEILTQRPVDDDQYIDEFVNDMIKGYLSNMQINDQNTKILLSKYLKKYWELTKKFQKYDGKDVIEHQVGNTTIAVDKDRNVYVNMNYFAYWDPATGLYKIKINNQEIDFNMNDENSFNKRRKQLSEMKKTIANIFNSDLNKNLEAINSIGYDENFLRLEKFKIPRTENLLHNESIYVAIYKNKVEVLDKAANLGMIENVKQQQLIGLTSKKNGLIVANDIGIISKGQVFTTQTEKSLKNLTINCISKNLETSLNETQLNYMIEKYEKENGKDENSKESALYDLALQQYSKLSEEEKANIILPILESKPKIIVSNQNNEIDVSVMFGNSAFKGTKECLVDVKNQHYIMSVIIHNAKLKRIIVRLLI